MFLRYLINKQFVSARC